MSFPYALVIRKRSRFHRKGSKKINAACLSCNGCKDKNNTETLVISGISVFFVFPVRLPVVKTTSLNL